MNEDILYTPEDIAKLLKLSKYTIYEMIKRGDLQAYRVGRSLRISKSQLELYLISKKKAENVYDAEIIEEKGSQYALIGTKKICVSTELKGRVKVSIRPEDIILCPDTIISSARNMLKGTVVDMICDDKSAKVLLDSGIPLLALITKKSLQEMNIKKGDVLYAVFKTMAVKVVK